jgi:hypothetical protein
VNAIEERNAEKLRAAEEWRCKSISDRVARCQCRLENGHDGDHQNDIYGVFWPPKEDT